MNKQGASVTVTAESLTDEQIREWESDEMARRRTTKTKRESVDLATDAIMTGIWPHPGMALSPQRREARARIAAAINARARES